jgi:glycosyltransferase 2 family protein
MQLSLGQRYRLISVGTFFNFCLPGATGGDVVKLYYLASEKRGRGVEMAMVLLIDRVVALASLLTLVIGLALLDGQLIREHVLIRWFVTVAGAAMGGLALVATISCSRTFRARGVFQSIIGILPFRRYFERASDAVYAFRNHKRAVTLAALVCLFGHLAWTGMFLCVGTILMPQAKGLTIAVLALIGMLANALPITPGGLGVGEAAFDRLFTLTGLIGGAPLLLAWRTGMLPLCAVGCVVYVIGMKRSSSIHNPSRSSDSGSDSEARNEVVGATPLRDEGTQ